MLFINFSISLFTFNIRAKLPGDTLGKDENINFMEKFNQGFVSEENFGLYALTELIITTILDLPRKFGCWSHWESLLGGSRSPKILIWNSPLHGRKCFGIQRLFQKGTHWELGNDQNQNQNFSGKAENAADSQSCSLK